ncbi:MAG TPA: hypothetical protein VKR23_03790 [Gaiellaceae bacterium]|nr:hypothetical protein [Gaiellaceae bacterium]
MSAAAYAAVLTDILAHAPRAAPGTATLGAAGAIVLVFVLVRATPAVVAWPPALLGAAYGIALVVHGSGVDDAAPLVAVGLLLCGELASWSIDTRLRIATERAVVRARGAAVASLAFASLAVAALVVALAAAPAGAGLAWTALGAAAIVGVVALAVALARRA